MIYNPLEDLRILIVDDQRSMRGILRRLLNDIGVRDIIEGSSGEDALEKIQTANEKARDLVICDLYMEHMDGLEFCKFGPPPKSGKTCGNPHHYLGPGSETK